MSGDAASLSCPVCARVSAFNSARALRDRLIHVSTNKIPCPVCQEEISGLDKLTIHLFSHVQVLTSKLDRISANDAKDTLKCENGTVSEQKKVRCVAKNKPSSSTATAPVKFVKIYPKLPVVSINPVPMMDISQRAADDGIQPSCEPTYVKTEQALVETNTTCTVCGLQFVDNNILRMHRCLIHNIDENTHQPCTRYDCHLCPKNFKMRGSLMVHLRVAHCGFSSANNCNDPNAHSINGKNLEECEDGTHNIDRNDNKQWQCDVCWKCFTTKYFLKKHKRLHTGETPYACTQCNKTFTFQQSYHKHLLYHNDEKPHSCSHCGRAFKELSTLHNHQRIHTGEKPFACETCGKCFRQRVSYLVHRRIHTGVMPYKCTACNKSFRYKVSQRTHKCQAQPPGTVVRHTGDLVEKLKKKQTDFDIQPEKNHTSLLPNISFIEISEASAELVRSGAKLSLEDMESDNFSIISETLNGDKMQQTPGPSHLTISNGDITDPREQRSHGAFHADIEDIIDSIPIEDRSVPSPSEILKKLSLSKEEDYGTLQDSKVDILKDFNIYL